MSEQTTDESPLAVVLAAGKGTRMKSDLPKVLCPANGRPLIAYVIDALQQSGVKRIVVVVGYRGDLVRETLAELPAVEFVEQTEQLGTGHAVKVCSPLLAAHRGPVVVLAGDSPMVQASSLEALLAEYQRHRPACILGTLHKSDPTGLGRIVRDAAGEFQRIVEEKDATPEQRQLTEVNMSTYVFDCEKLLATLEALEPKNKQNEYYLTDCPGILQASGERVAALPVLQPCEALSVNTPEELGQVELELAKGVGGAD